MDLLKICGNLSKKWKGRQIFILMDEIIYPEKILSSLAEQSESFPTNVTIIGVVNPRRASNLPTLPESVLHINLTIPYRSTIAITSLARFLEGVDVSKGEFGSDVQGKKPIAFDVGADEVKLKLALQRSREQLGDNATLLFDPLLPSSLKEICERHGNEKGGPWECYIATHFYGWEAEKVVAVATGRGAIILEQATRAKTELILIIAESEGAFKKLRQDYTEYYPRLQKTIKAAADKDLLDVKVVKGKKPIVYDVGADEYRLEIALQRSSERLGDDVTLLYDYFLSPSMIKICENHGTEKGGPCLGVLQD